MHLAKQGLAFRGHDETPDSFNKGNFLETLRLIADSDKDLAVAQEILPQNAKYTSPDIQKELTKAAADLVRKALRDEIGDNYYCLIVDEARCAAKKEWMSVVIRFVDGAGLIRERFLGAVHVLDTRSATLFEAILEFLNQFELDIQKLRGQAFDGASNMRGEFNGLQALIRSKAPSAYYVHCFAHRLNLVIVSVATEVDCIAKFFYIVQQIFTICGASCKRSDALRSSRAAAIEKALMSGEVSSGKGLNQHMSLGSISATRWNCRISALQSITVMFESICYVLKMVSDDGTDSGKRVEAEMALHAVTSFEFAFGLVMMTEVLSITNALSTSLQRKDQDFVNACALVQATKNGLDELRNDGFPQMIERTVQFCQSNDVEYPDLDQTWKPSGRRGRGRPPQNNGLSHRDFYKIEVFYPVLDRLQSEMGIRFSEGTSSLIELASSIQPVQQFAQFDPCKILKLADLYSSDFNDLDRLHLETELRMFKGILAVHPDFHESPTSISNLLAKMVSAGLEKTFPVYSRLIRVVLTLPVSTATTERSFSALKIIKTRLRTSMGDPWLMDLLLLYIEKEVTRKLHLQSVTSQFKNMKSRRI